MIEELAAHLFLKRSNAAMQWSSKAFQEIPELNCKLTKLPETFVVSHADFAYIGEKDLVIAPAEFDFKPDTNSLVYVSSLLQALNAIGCLNDCLESLEQRMASELFAIVEQEIKVISEKMRKSRPFRDAQHKYVLIGTGMSTLAKDEFLQFCPLLRELISVVVAKLVVILNNFKFVTQAIQNMTENEAYFEGSESPLRIAIQAVLREIKNFATSVVYSHMAPTESYSNPIADIAEILKNSKSKSTADSSDLFRFQMTLDDDSIKEIKSLPNNIRDKDRAVAKRISASLNIDPHSTSRQDSGHKQIVKPNIQFLVLLFQPIILLCNIVESLVGGGGEDHSVQAIVTFFTSAMEKEYIPFLENYVIHELVAAFKSNDQSSWVDLLSDQSRKNALIGKSSGSIMTCYLTFVRLICELSRLIYFVPECQGHFERLMEQLCDQLLDKSELRLRDLILAKYAADDDATAANSLCLSVQFAKHPELRAILSENTLLLSGNVNCAINRVLAVKESLVMERLKGDRSISRNELIFDVKIIRDLALLQRSFDQLRTLLLEGRYTAAAAAQRKRKDEEPAGMTRMILDESKNIILQVYEEGKKTVFQLGSAFEAKFVIFSELLDKLAQTCLFTLHAEIRTHCFYYLDLAFREGNYNLDTFCGEPDPYVAALTLDLQNLSSILADWFPLSKYLFLFDGLPALVDQILVNNFQYIKALNAIGCRKLVANVTALIQLLTQILPPTEAALPRATEYYRLALLPVDDLLPEIQARGCQFTFMQYRALLDAAYRSDFANEDLAAASEARKRYTNHLNALRCLTENTSST